MLRYLTDWLAGIVWWRKGRREGAAGEGKEVEQGRFLFSLLIDSQMSGGVEVSAARAAAAAALSGTFPFHK